MKIHFFYAKYCRIPAIIFMMLWSTICNGTSIGILTNGGDRDSYVDDWREQNIDRVCRGLRNIGVGECQNATSKAQLENRITAAVERLECGDTLVLYFNGHGSDDKGFVFDKEDHDSDDRHVQPSEILEWLDELDCCVSIYVAWHACYSGRFTEEISEDPHVKLAVSSASESETAHRGVLRRPGLADYIHPFNWPDGFAGGLEGEGSFAEIFQHAAKEGKEAAEDTDNIKRDPYEDDPQDFKRGHIEEVERTSGGFNITLKVGSGTVDVFLPRGSETGFDGLSRSELEFCMDIEVSGDAEFNNDGNFTATQANVTHFGGKFHVLEIEDRDEKRVRVVYTEPAGLKDHVGVVIMDPLPDDIQFCKWYEFHGAVSGQTLVSHPDSLEGSTPESYTWEGHVQEVDEENNEFVIRVTRPRPLRGREMKVKAKAGEDLPDGIDPCMNITFQGIPSDGDIILDSDIDVEVEGIRAHVEEVNQEAREVKVTITGRPQRRDGDTLLLRPDPFERIDNLEFCKTIHLRGKVYKDEIREGTNINIE